ncbi:MAG: hypothetical protein U0984_11545 [Prosthecobacter sp.]|nr:hypothetical protein [Prosthecobacter sp.]
MSLSSASPPNPRQLFHLLDSGRMSLAEFREAMAVHARELIVEMEEDSANPLVAFLEQMLCRRAASKLERKHGEVLVREVLLALSEIPDFPPGRWLWNAAHPHLPLHAFFRVKREPVFRIVLFDAMPQVITLTVEHGRASGGDTLREEIRLRRDRRGQLGLERRRALG